MKRHAKQTFFTCVVLALPAMAVWLPLLWMVTGVLTGSAELQRTLGPAFSERGEAFAVWRMLPQFPTLEPFAELLLDTPEFFVLFWNSTLQTFAQCAGQVAVGAPAAWAISRLRFRGRGLLLGCYIVLMLLPFQVTMVPSYLVLRTLGLMDTHWAVILPGVFSAFPVFIMNKNFDAVPHALLEAAALDGAGHWQRFWRIGVPLGVPGILSAVVLCFLESWNAVEQPMTFFKSRALWPLSLYMPTADIGQLGAAMAASFVMLLPCLLLFRFGQPYLELGIQASGIKE